MCVKEKDSTAARRRAESFFELSTERMVVYSVQKLKMYLEWRELEVWIERCSPRERSYVCSLQKLPCNSIDREETEEVRNIDQVVSVAHFDADELRRDVKSADDCRRLLSDRRDRKLPGEGSTKKIMKSESGSSVSEAVPYKKKVLAALRRWTVMSSSQDATISSQDPPKDMRHPS